MGILERQSLAGLRGIQMRHRILPQAMGKKIKFEIKPGAVYELIF